MIFVDSHCHVDGAEFDPDREEVIARAEANGVKMMLVVGTGEPRSGNFERAVALAEKHANIFAAVGVHPHDAKTFNAEAEIQLKNLVKSSKKVVAWGEIGLDFYYEHSPRDVQEDVFRRQIGIAKELDLPIIIHSREADAETVRILTEECSGKMENGKWETENKTEGDEATNKFRGGVMHCFGGTAAMAESLMEIGFLISFAGNVTFKKAENLREAARVVPLDKLLIETDCPYLAPVPFRGKRNEPMFVTETAKFLAEFYSIELEELAKQTTQNFLDFFRIKK
jgi:TatD DNase family protein